MQVKVACQLPSLMFLRYCFDAKKSKAYEMLISPLIIHDTLPSPFYQGQVHEIAYFGQIGRICFTVKELMDEDNVNTHQTKCRVQEVLKVCFNWFKIRLKRLFIERTLYQPFLSTHCRLKMWQNILICMTFERVLTILYAVKQTTYFVQEVVIQW